METIIKAGTKWRIKNGARSPYTLRMSDNDDEELGRAWFEDAAGNEWGKDINCDDTQPYLEPHEWSELTDGLAISPWEEPADVPQVTCYNPVGSRAWLDDVADKILGEESKLRDAGQKEYARTQKNVFANFDRVAERIKVKCDSCDHVQSLDRKHVLLVYLEKHLDGIHSYVGGHQSQREGVEGRIGDARVYLLLLRAMKEFEEQTA